jgi:hypothetical protein
MGSIVLEQVQRACVLLCEMALPGDGHDNRHADSGQTCQGLPHAPITAPSVENPPGAELVYDPCPGPHFLSTRHIPW